MEEKIRFATGNISRKRERVALYARATTDGQTPEKQLQELQNIADQSGWRVTREFVDQGISLPKGKDQRPKFDEMCKDTAISKKKVKEAILKALKNG